MSLSRGATRLDGAQGKKQVGRPLMFEPEVFRKQMHCVEKAPVTLLGLFRAPPSIPPWSLYLFSTLQAFVFFAAFM